MVYLLCLFPLISICCNRYLAVALTVVGTLVDLVPEALLLTEIAMHPRVMSPGEKGSLKEILLLFFSDGKPIIAFAAESDVPNERLRMVQISIRRRYSILSFDSTNIVVKYPQTHSSEGVLLMTAHAEGKRACSLHV